MILESVRGTDLYLLVDVANYSLTYSLCGHENHMSPDDHYQDLKRIIAAVGGKARRVNVIMPFLYESRQHKRTKRESLDAALALQELVDMGVSNIITFDAHDPRVQNAIPLHGFDSFNPPYQFMKALLKAEPDLKVDKEHMTIISPEIEIEGILFTMDASRYNNSKRNKKAVYSAYGKEVNIFEEAIPRSEAIAEIASEGVSIFEYDKLSKGAESYEKLAQEVLNHAKAQ